MEQKKVFTPITPLQVSFSLFEIQAKIGALQLRLLRSFTPSDTLCEIGTKLVDASIALADIGSLVDYLESYTDHE